MIHVRSAARRGSRVTSALAVWALGLLALGLPARGETLTEPDTSAASRQQIVRSIPWTSLDREAQAKLSTVMNRPTMYRRMPLHEIRTAPEMYVFLAGNPDVVVNVWEVLKISRVNLKRVAPAVYDAEDLGGTRTRIEIIHASPQQHIFYAEGEYRGGLFGGPIRGRGVLVLSSEFYHDETGAEYAVSRLDVFLQLDGLGAELLLKTAQGYVGRMADHNFVETSKFIEKLSYTSEVNPEGMQRLSTKLARVQPDVRDEFARISATVAERAAMLEAAAAAASATQLADTAPLAESASTIRGQEGWVPASRVTESREAPASAAPASLPTEPYGTPRYVRFAR